MKDPKLYVNPWDTPGYKHSLDVTFRGISEYHDVIFDTDRRHTSRNDVPPMYRRSIRRDVARIVFYTVCGLLILNCILFFATII